MNRRDILRTLGAALVLPAAARARTPKPVTSQYFVTEFAGFFVTLPVTEVRYQLVLSVSESLARPAWLQVEYENPGRPNDPDVQYLEVAPGQAKLELSSRELSPGKHRKQYRVTVEVFSDQNMRNKIGEHVQPVEYIAIRI